MTKKPTTTRYTIENEASPKAVKTDKLNLNNLFMSVKQQKLSYFYGFLIAFHNEMEKLFSAPF